MTRLLPAALVLITVPQVAAAQPADAAARVWSEPQVRYLLADLHLGGKPDLYRNYATHEKDPDSREAVRLWDAGGRVVNADRFERKWVPNPHGKDGRVMRVVLRGTNRTITGDEVVLTSDDRLEMARIRLIVADLSLGRSAADYDKEKDNPSVAEALRRYADGARVIGPGKLDAIALRTIVHKGTVQPADGGRLVLNTDLPYAETSVRYFLADIALGGSADFYHAAAERDHETSCAEAVRRVKDGYTVTNLDQFERKRVNGKVTITKKGSDARIGGMDVKLSSDE